VRILSATFPADGLPLETENIPSVDKIMRTIREELKAGGWGRWPPAGGKPPLAEGGPARAAA
jgi:hypothetical protein